MELPKECIYCLAKRLYIGTNAKLKSKESISSRFDRLYVKSDSSKRAKSLTVSLSKDGGTSRNIYRDKDDVSSAENDRESPDLTEGKN